MKRYLIALPLIAACSQTPATPTPARLPPGPPERAIRRTIPMTNTILRAHSAGTRDSTGAPGRKYWQTSVDYRIEARLDPATHTISGRETIVLHNNGDRVMTSVYLRLDQNIFRPDVARLSSVGQNTEGMKIERLVINGQSVDMKPTPGIAATGSAPAVATAVGITQTSARIMLPLNAAIAPKTSATLEIDWKFEITRVLGFNRGLRMGALGDSLFQVAQWYPRIAAYDDLRGWDTEPYLGPSEFYNNFGTFDVKLDVPAGWLVGATGVLQNGEQVLSSATRERLARVLQTDSVVKVVTAEERATQKASLDKRQVWHFAADSVNDFAWAASSSYVWDAIRANIPGKGYVPVNVLYLPGHRQGFERVPEVTRHALQFYSQLWMPYAFPQLTVADGPELGM